jgi:hypothetical protein
MPASPDDDAATRLANRETVRLPIQRRPARSKGSRARKAPLALAATVTTAWAALVSLTPMLVVVALVHAVDNSGASANRVARLGLAAWLLAHGVPLQTGLGPIGLAPLALSVFTAWRVARAGVHTARAIGARRGGPATGAANRWRGTRRSLWRALAAGVAVGGVYGVLGALAAAATLHQGVGISIVRAGLTLGLFGLVAGVGGALIEARVLARLAVSVPPVIRDGVRTGAVAALLILGGGAALAGMAIAINGGDAGQILHDYRAGVTGQVGLTLVCALYGPNIAVWAASYLVGPGFMIGAGTSISAAGVTLGPLPAVPVLAGLPGGPATGWGSLLLGVPVAAALLAGWLLGRRTLRGAPRSEPPKPAAVSWTRLIGAAALAGPVAGLLLGLASLAASGSLGAGRLADVGPHAGWVAVVAAVVVAVGTALAASATKIFLGVRLSRP